MSGAASVRPPHPALDDGSCVRAAEGGRWCDSSADRPVQEKEHYPADEPGDPQLCM